MAHSHVVQAVRAHLAANWTDCPIAEENTGFEAPKDGSSFLSVQYPTSRSERVSFGAPGFNRYRETGAFWIVINVKRDTGADLGREWADRLADLFRGLTLGSLRIGAPDSASTDNRNETGNYFQLSFAVPYRFDTFG